MVKGRRGREIKNLLYKHKIDWTIKFGTSLCKVELSTGKRITLFQELRRRDPIEPFPPILGGGWDFQWKEWRKYQDRSQWCHIFRTWKKKEKTSKVTKESLQFFYKCFIPSCWFLFWFGLVFCPITKFSREMETHGSLFPPKCDPIY